MHHPEPDPRDDLTALERRLGRWQPVPGRLDRDRMLFEAGRAASGAVAARWIHRAATAALALVATTFGGLFLQERAERQSLEVALAARPAAAEPAPSPDAEPDIETPLPEVEPPTIAPNSYLALTYGLLGGRQDAPPVEPRRDPPPDGPRSPLSPLDARDPGRIMNL